MVVMFLFCISFENVCELEERNCYFGCIYHGRLGMN